MSSQTGMPSRTPLSITRAGHLAHMEHPFLVEFAVIGQVDLVAAGDQPALVEHGHGI